LPDSSNSKELVIMIVGNESYWRLNISATLAAIFAAYPAATNLVAQNFDDSGWQSQAQARLIGIYDRNDFRPKDYQPRWLRDSSGFVIGEVDPRTQESVWWFVDVQTGERRAWKSDENLLSPNAGGQAIHGRHRLESRDSRLLVVDQQNQHEIVLATAAEDRDIEYRDASWSPDGSRVVFIQADSSDVRQRSVLAPGDPSYPEVQQRRFARVGGEIDQLRVGIVNADGQHLRWLPIRYPDEGNYLGQVEWAGNSSEVLVETFSRFRDKREILLVTASGQVKTIFSEANEAWVESSQGKNSRIEWIRGGSEFVVITEMDGWRHAYRYTRQGTKVALLTPGDYDIIDRAVIDEEGGWFYFYASPHDATQKYLYRVSLDGDGESQRISPENQVGTHTYRFSPDSKWAIHTYSTLDTPPVHTLVEIETHRIIKTLEDNNEIRDRMKSILHYPTEFLKLDIGSGIVLDAWMIKPPGFDSSKKYPLLVYVYGEPHAQTVLNEWGAAQIDFHRLVAEMGYVVVSIDNRGTPAPKGAAWRRAIFGSLGPLSTEEQEAGLKALAKQCPCIDLTRVGIWGWSGGGSNTLNALFRKPSSYQVGIAVVPKPQPHLYNAWFQEIYMRDREVNAAGYERSAPINFAEGLRGKLLIITGSGETNTHIQIIEDLVDRLIALGKPFDYMVYPNRDHGLREGDGTVVHVRMRILRYLMECLPSGPQ
jgi:dipeptidyl-peptidase-4